MKIDTVTPSISSSRLTGRIFFGAKLLPFSWLSVLLLTPLPSVMAQQNENEKKEEVVRLDAFEVSASDLRGYNAERSTAGTLIAVPIGRMPLSLQVVTPQLIADMDARRVEDAIRYVSGVGLAARNEGASGSTSTERFVIRGFETSAVLRNGLRQQGITNSANLERVEILKGPSSIFFGAADPGGIVNYITKQPLPEKFASIRTVAGRFDGYYGEFDFNVPLHTDKLLMRVTGSISTEKSWRKFYREEQQFLNPVIVWTPNARTRLSYEFQARRQTGLRERNGDIWLTTDGPFPFNQNFLTGAEYEKSVEVGNLLPTDTYWEYADSHVARLVQTIGEKTVVQVNFGSGDSNRRQRTTFAMNRPTRAGNLQYSDRPGYLEEGAIDRTLSVNILHEFELWSTQHKLLMGWDRSEIQNKNLAVAYTATSPSSTIRRLMDPLTFAERYSVKSYPSLADVGVRSDVTLIANSPWRKPVWGQGFFITDQITALDGRLTVIGGTRYSQLREQDRDATTPQIGANFAVTPQISVYGLYSKSFRGNGRSDSRDPNSSFLPPEEGEGIEAGAKFRWLDGKLTGTAAVFKVNKKNIRRINSGAAVAGFNGVTLSGEEESKGVELDLVYAPTKNFSAIVSFSDTNAQLVSDTINSSTAPDLDGDGRPDTLGLRLKQVSPRTAATWLRYEFTDGSLKDLTIGGGYQYRQGPIPLDASYARKFLTQPSYGRLDLFASYRTRMFGRLTRFQVNLDNITDEYYIDKAFGVADPFMWRAAVSLDL